MRGTFIAFEGADGSGKSTVAGHVAASLEAAGVPVTLTREPGGTEVGRHLRRILLESELSCDPVTELLLMCADRAEHVRSVILPALGRGTCVLSDRYAASTRAYQGAGLGIDVASVEAAIEVATGGLTPDLNVLFDVPSEVALERRQRRNGDQNEIDRRSVQFHERVRADFLAQARSHPREWIVIDASQPLAVVIGQAMSAIESVLAKRPTSV